MCADHNLVHPERCEHMAAMLEEFHYRRDDSGLLLVKTCLRPLKSNSPMRHILRDLCGLTSPIDAEQCYSCGGTHFGPPRGPITELFRCHYRCPHCKWLTPECNAKVCWYCGRPNPTLLRPAVCFDIYGKMIAKRPAA